MGTNISEKLAPCGYSNSGNKEFQVIHSPSNFEAKLKVKFEIGLFRLSALKDSERLLSSRPLLSSDKTAPILHT